MQYHKLLAIASVPIFNNIFCQSEANTGRKRALLRHHLSAVYEIDREIGQGGFGKVNIGRHKNSNTEVAIKKMPKTLTSERQFRNEVEMLRRVGGKHYIIELREAFDTVDSYVIVTEVAQGGELFERLVEDGVYEEKFAAKVMKEGAQALAFLNSKHIVHGDIKPENFVLMSNKKDAEVRLVDFGLACSLNEQVPNGALKKSGTIAYSAPEVLLGKGCDGKSDVFALGLVLYIMLAGYHPFDTMNDACDEQVKRNIIAGKFHFMNPAWRNVSKSAKDLLMKMLAPNPENRPTASEVLNHKWIKKFVKSENHTIKMDKLEEAAQSKFYTTMAAVVVQSAAQNTEKLLNTSMDNLTNSTKGNADKIAADSSSWIQAFEEDNMELLEAIQSLDPLKKGFINAQDLLSTMKGLGHHEIDETQMKQLIAAVVQNENQTNLPFAAQHLQYVDLARIMNQLPCASYKQDEIIFRQDENSDDVFVVLGGKVQCSIDMLDSKNQAKNIQIRTVQPGNFFGDSTHRVKNNTRYCTAKCDADTCRVLILPPRQLEDISKMCSDIQDRRGQDKFKLLSKFITSYLSNAAACSKSQIYKQGDILCQQSESSDVFYVVQSGKAQVIQKLDSGRNAITEHLQAGDFFPLGVLKDNHGPNISTRDATVQCISDELHVLAIEGQVLREYLTSTSCHGSTQMLQDALQDEIQRRRNQRHRRTLRMLSRAATK